MMIHREKCRDLGLPEPKRFDTQSSYLLRAMTNGHRPDTRICRYIGIHNLHSIASALLKKGYEFVRCRGRVPCPFTGKIPIEPVVIIYMTKQQQRAFKSGKKKTR